MSRRLRVVLPERRAGGAAARLLGSRAVQYLLLCADTAYDLARGVRFLTPLRAHTTERRRLEALLSVQAHKIEKRLTLAAPSDASGSAPVRALLDLVDAWTRSVRDAEAVAFLSACAALRAYQARGGDRLRREDPALADRLTSFLDGVPSPPEPPARDGATRDLTAHEFREEARRVDFARFAGLRHSVRSFAPEPIPDDALERAVRVAQRTPSVCNRQAWRVHVFTSPEDREAVLRIQDGNAGFGHLAARVLLVSCDTRVYVTSGERHQAYVDGGMFAMSLVYALQAEGIASCCLNLCNYFFQDVAVHRVCRIPGWEAPIMMIAVGYPAAEFRVAASERLDTGSVLAWRRL
jgi:nitroreductase